MKKKRRVKRKLRQCWVVCSLTSKKLYGPFPTALAAVDAAMKNMNVNSTWVIQRVERIP